MTDRERRERELFVRRDNGEHMSPDELNASAVTGTLHVYQDGNLPHITTHGECCWCHPDVEEYEHARLIIHKETS